MLSLSADPGRLSTRPMEQTMKNQSLPAVPATEYPGQGAILDAATFHELAAEYLIGAHESPVSASRAVSDSVLFGRFLDGVVETWATYPRFDGAPAEAYRYDGKTWVPVANPEPYAGLPELTEAYGRELKPVAVSSEYCDHPVWSQSTNVRFRVWHDTEHVRWQLGFDVDGELQLFAVQACQLARAGRLAELDSLFCESVYQLAACVVLGGFPDTQHVRSLGPVGRRVLGQLLVLGAELCSVRVAS